jgi:hypothetical protein
MTVAWADGFGCCGARKGGRRGAEGHSACATARRRAMHALSHIVYRLGVLHPSISCAKRARMRSKAKAFSCSKCGAQRSAVAAGLGTIAGAACDDVHARRRRHARQSMRSRAAVAECARLGRQGRTAHGGRTVKLRAKTALSTPFMPKVTLLLQQAPTRPAPAPSRSTNAALDCSSTTSSTCVLCRSLRQPASSLRSMHRGSQRQQGGPGKARTAPI